MRRRQWQGGGDAESGKLGQHGLLVESVGLVDHGDDRLAAAAQLAKDHVILRQQPVAGIDHEDQDVGFLDRQAHLLRGEHVHGVLDAGQTAGIDHHKRPIAAAANAVMAIPGNPGHIGHQRIAAARQHVEKG